MRKLITVIGIALIGLSTYAKGIPTSWVMRNGLTDEQIDKIFEANPNASLRLTKDQWMNLRYRAYRFHNVTNYLSSYISEGTNSFSKIMLGQLDRIDELNVTNSVLRKLRNELKDRVNILERDVITWMNDSTNAWHQFDISTNELSTVRAQLDDFRSQLDSKISELSEAIAARHSAEARAERIEAVKSKIEELRDKAILSTTKKIYDEILKLFD